MRVPSKTGFAVVDRGSILLWTISDDQRAAISKWMASRGSSMSIMAGQGDTEFYKRWTEVIEENERGDIFCTTVTVEVRYP